MIGPISNSYTSVQWPSYQNRTRNNAPTEAVSPLAHKPANPEIPVQPAEAATPVTVRATGNVHAGLPLRGGVDPAEMAVCARISPVEPREESVQALSARDGSEEMVAPLPGIDREDTVPTVMGAEDENAAAPLPGAGDESVPAVFGGKDEEAAEAVDNGEKPGQEIREKLEAEKAERQERAEERVQQQAEAQAQREEYANELKAREEARAERLESLRDSTEVESGKKGTDADQASPEQDGYLQLDHAAALLRNRRMTNLLNEHLSGRAEGRDTTLIRDAIDTLFQNGQHRVRFGGGEEDADQSAYRQRFNGYATQRNNPFAA